AAGPLGRWAAGPLGLIVTPESSAEVKRIVVEPFVASAAPSNPALTASAKGAASPRAGRRGAPASDRSREP
ncbi:MAG: hypothetical protein OXL68_20865, partial [Paracoccaceae bacterium]|nr:hypothetical protein [Paracoccaceae bacterium]